MALQIPLALSGGGTVRVGAADAVFTGWLPPPQGRLTLTSGTPVMTAGVSGATSVIYTPAVGNMIPLWNGSAFVPVTFTEKAISLSGLAAGTVYDVFGYLSAGAATFIVGPAWSAGTTAGSTTARGSGAGSTALNRVNGLLINAAAITNGPAAGYGTYLGTIVTDSSGATLSLSFGTLAAGGGAAYLPFWNQYNRVPVSPRVNDTTASWQYKSSTTRMADASASNRVTFVTGQAEDPVSAQYQCLAYVSASGGSATVGIGLDSTTTVNAYSTSGEIYSGGASNQGNVVASLRAPAVLGLHYVQALEASDNTNTNTFSGGTYQALSADLRY